MPLPPMMNQGGMPRLPVSNPAMPDMGNVQTVAPQIPQQPTATTGVNGMSLPGDAMQRQELVFNQIISKYGAGSWGGVKGGVY